MRSPSNLEISNLEICGRKPEGDKSSLADASFLQRARAQIDAVANASLLPKDLETEYARKLAAIDLLISGGNAGPEPRATCSLVQSIDNVKQIPVPGIRAIGHGLIIPEFGWMALCEVEMGERTYKGSPRPTAFSDLMMARINLGCVGGGKLGGGTAGSNGGHKP